MTGRFVAVGAGTEGAGFTFAPVPIAGIPLLAAGAVLGFTATKGVGVAFGAATTGAVTGAVAGTAAGTRGVTVDGTGVGMNTVVGGVTTGTSGVTGTVACGAAL